MSNIQLSLWIVTDNFFTCSSNMTLTLSGLLALSWWYEPQNSRSEMWCEDIFSNQLLSKSLSYKTILKFDSSSRLVIFVFCIVVFLHYLWLQFCNFDFNASPTLFVRLLFPLSWWHGHLTQDSLLCYLIILHQYLWL